MKLILLQRRVVRTAPRNKAATMFMVNKDYHKTSLTYCVVFVLSK